MEEYDNTYQKVGYKKKKKNTKIFAVDFMARWRVLRKLFLGSGKSPFCDL